MNERIMILGASFDQIPMIAKANAMGLYVIAVDGNPQAPGFSIADETHTIEVMETDRILALAQKRKIDGITTMVSNLGMRTVAEVSKVLGLTAIAPDAAKMATDKTIIKSELEKAGVPVPVGLQVSTSDEALEKADQFTFPVIVKPADGTKGRGIARADDAQTLHRAVENALTFSPGRTIVIEELIEGPTVGAEGLVIDGTFQPVLLTDKFNTEPPHFVTLGLTTPSNLPKDVQKRVGDTAARVAETLRMTTGAGHIDMVIDTDGTPKVIDVGPRLASGPVIFDFALNLMGVDMIQSVIRMSLGQKVTLSPSWNGEYGCSRFLSAATPGCMYNIDFPSINGDFSFYPYKVLGQPVTEPESDTDRIGCITITATTYEAAIQKADALLAKTQVDILA